MAPKPPLLVVDAPSLLFRSFYALPKKITNDEGQSVNALLGTANYLLRVVEDRSPRAVVLCSGPDAAEYRLELYDGYHADRPPVPDELAPQFADAPAFFEAFGWHWVASEDLEADDLLGSLAAAEVEAGGEALILTGDRDMYQCAGDGVTVLYVKTGSRGPEEVDAEEVRRRYGVSPGLVPDFIALRGDPSDGIPGAKGIGEKTAREILRVHGSLEEAIANAAKERPKVAATLRDQAPQLHEFKQMATLVHIPVDRPADRPTAFAAAATAAEERGMNRLAQRLRGLAA